MDTSHAVASRKLGAPTPFGDEECEQVSDRTMRPLRAGAFVLQSALLFVRNRPGWEVSLDQFRGRLNERPDCSRANEAGWRAGTTHEILHKQRGSGEADYSLDRARRDSSD